MSGRALAEAQDRFAGRAEAPTDEGPSPIMTATAAPREKELRQKRRTHGAVFHTGGLEFFNEVRVFDAHVRKRNGLVSPARDAARGHGVGLWRGEDGSAGAALGSRAASGTTRPRSPPA